MTQGYQPPARGSNAGADQDTATLPKVPAGQHSGNWSASTAVSSDGASAAPSAGEEGSPGFGAKIASAASAAASTATSAATTAKGAMRNAASEAESRAGRRAGRRQPRRARLTLSHINVYSVFKFSCVLAIALFFVWLIMVGVLYGVLDASNVISNVNDTVVQLNGSGSKPPITAGVVFGGAAIVGVVNIVLFVALTTIGSVIYNLCADLVGGIEITLSER